MRFFCERYRTYGLAFANLRGLFNYLIMKDHLSYSHLAKIYKEEGNKKEEKKLDNICEECKKEDESVSQNLIIHGYKICDSCKISKTIFPV